MNIVIGLAFLSLTLSETVVGQTSTKQNQATTRSVVSHYIGALQKRDFQTIIPLNGQLVLGEDLIRRENPKVLWPNLIRAYRESRIAELQHKKEPGVGEEYKIQEIDRLLELLPQGCQWSIIEVRREPRSPSYPGLSMDTVYVAVSYLSADQSPTVDGKHLKKAIIEFPVMSAGPQFSIEDHTQVNGGNEFWEAP